MSGKNNLSTADWLTPRRFALLLAALILACWLQVFLGLETFVYRDYGYFSYPLAKYFRESFWRGEVPLWNPLSYCGIPFLAQWNSQTLYPPALFYLLLPFTWALGVFCLLHMFFGGLGMYLLARRWTENSFAAAFAGLVFAGSGLMLNSLMWSSTIASLAWMPWVVSRVEIATRTGGRQLIVAALCGAVQMLSGTPEVIALTWVIAGVVVLSGGGVKPLVCLAGIVLLVAALAAVQLLPFLDLLAHSHRTNQFRGDTWAMPLTGPVNFFAPLIRLHPGYHGVYCQPGQQWTASYYLGGATLVLAAVAVFRLRQRRVWLLAALAVLGVALALGNAGKIYALAAHLPGLSVMRYPIKFVVLPIFIVPLLAAYALAGVPAGEPSKKFPRLVGMLWFALLLLAVAALAWVWNFPAPEENWGVTWRNTALRALCFTAILGGVVALKGNFKFAWRCWLPGVLLAVVWFDLVLNAPRQQTVNPDNYSAPWPRVPAPPAFGKGRLMNTAGADAELRRFRIDHPEGYFICRRWALVENCNLIENIPMVQGFFSLRLRSEMEVAAQLLWDTNSYPAALADFLGVTQVNLAGDVFTWVPRPTALPLVTGGQGPTYLPTDVALGKLGSPDFNPLREVLLPHEAQAFIKATNVPVKISGVQWSAHCVSAKIQADAPALVVVAQSFYHCWRGYVDGRPVKVWRANHNSQAVEVPAGSHELKLVYEDRQFQLGAAISLVALAGCLIFWAWRRRMPTSPATS